MKEDCWYVKVCSEDCAGCVRYLEMKYLIYNSGIPKNRQYPEELTGGVDFDQFVRLSDIKANMVEFVNTGKNLFICSQYTGNGKTSWSIKLLLKYFDEIWAGNGFRVRGLFVNVPTLLLELKNFETPISAEYRKNLMDADLVIWDEIGFGNLSNYDYTNLLMFLDYRISAGKANIFTSNITRREDLEKSLGAKLTSRIWNTSNVIIFNGKDRR